MNYETVLLIGGPRDGERMSVMPGLPSIEFQSLPVSVSIPGTPGHIVPTTRVVYRRSPVQSDKGFNGAVYVVEGVDAMPQLINGYRGSRSAFEGMASGRGYNIEQYNDRYVSKITQELFDFWSGALP